MIFVRIVLRQRQFLRQLPLTILLLLWQHPGHADTASAELAMEDPLNPLLLISTSQGNIYIELFPNEAPRNVANFLALATGEVEFIDADTGAEFKPRYFNGLRFHRVITDFIIQTGSGAYHPRGAPADQLPDEINADYLGLDRLPVLNPDGSFNSMLNISNKAEFDEEILKPLYRRMNIESKADLLARQEAVLIQLQQMTVKRAYENQGYSYNSSNPGRGISRGVVALANKGPDTNAAEFFIALTDADWLTGKHTVIGKVVEGMEVADTIGAVPIDPLQFSRLSTLLYSVRRIH
ncbi:MAG: peptidylprolyl isomerase [Proteobacteria bacterium]|nr:peptidylprolyl isomerase [Pseudomonadota bacterium]